MAGPKPGHCLAGGGSSNLHDAQAHSAEFDQKIAGRAICSTFAQAFHSIRYPILPQIEIAEDNLAKLQSEYARAEIFHIRSHTLFTPHDFDISPYFAVIKPMIEAGFDHRTLTWAEESTLDRTGHRSSS
jgi:hypothetical protein